MFYRVLLSHSQGEKWKWRNNREINLEQSTLQAKVRSTRYDKEEKGQNNPGGKKDCVFLKNLQILFS